MHCLSSGHFLAVAAACYTPTSALHVWRKQLACHPLLHIGSCDSHRNACCRKAAASESWLLSGLPAPDSLPAPLLSPPVSAQSCTYLHRLSLLLQDVELPAEQVKAMFGMRAEYWTPQTASAQPAQQPVLRQTAAPGSSTGPAEVGLQAAPATQAAAASSGWGVQVQRAADRAHNEAVLAGSSTDAALAQSLQDEEQQVGTDHGRLWPSLWQTGRHCGRLFICAGGGIITSEHTASPASCGFVIELSRWMLRHTEHLAQF